MERKALRQIKQTAGRRLPVVEFIPARRAKLPKPLDKLSGGNLRATPLYEVGGDVRATFVWRSADILEKRALFGFLFRETDRGIEPLARLDYHLSHKNLHVMLPCDVSIDLTNRHVVQGRELALHAVELDPDNETDRSRFVSTFCERFNIKLGEEGLLP